MSQKCCKISYTPFTLDRRVTKDSSLSKFNNLMKILGADEKNAAKVTKTLIFYEKCYFCSNYLVCRAGISEKQPRTNSCMLFLLQKDRNLMLLAITSTSGRVKMSMGPKTFIDKDT